MHASEYIFEPGGYDASASLNWNIHTPQEIALGEIRLNRFNQRVDRLRSFAQELDALISNGPEQKSRQPFFRSIRRTGLTLAAGTALLAATAVPFVPGAIDFLQREAIASEVNPEKRIDLANIMDTQNKSWGAMAESPKWRRTYIANPIPESASTLPWEMILLVDPSDNIKTKTYFPYRVDQSLMKGEGVIDISNGAIALLEFSANGNPDTPRNTDVVIGDAYIEIANSKTPETGKNTLAVSITGNRVQAHFLENDVRSYARATASFDLFEVQDATPNRTDIKMALIFDSELRSIIPVSPEGKLLERITLPKPLAEDKKLIGISGGSRRGIEGDFSKVMIARPLP